MLADMEEKFGKTRHVLAAYDKATSAVLPEEKLEVCISECFHSLTAEHLKKKVHLLLSNLLTFNSAIGL